MTEKQEGKVSKEQINKAFHETASDKPRLDINNLVATKLAIAFYSTDALIGIRHTLESILAIPQENYDLAGLDPEIREKAARYRSACTCLIKFRKVNEDTGIIAFDFDPEDADLYLSFFKGWESLDLYPEKWKEAKSANNRRYYLKLLVLNLKDGAPLGLCDTIINAFINEVTMFTYPLTERLFRNYISAEQWAQALGFVSGGFKNVTG
jgi:hypothetical protein